MLKEYPTIALLFIGLLLAAASLHAQDDTQNRREAPQRADPVVLYSANTSPIADGESAKDILEQIRQSIAENNPRGLQRYFSSKVYISLLTGKEGYFSAEQSYFIIKSFFLTYTPVAFTYSNSTTESDNPYGVGTLQYVTRGKQGKAQLFVSLTRTETDWRIGQITITDR